MNIKCSILGLLIASLALISCEKRNVYQGEEGDGNSGEANPFSYSTKQQVEINLHYNVPKNYRVAFEAYYTTPVTVNEAKDYVVKEGVTPFLTGYTDANGNFNLSADIPAFVENIYVYTHSTGVPALLEGRIEGNKVTLSEKTSLKSKALSTRSGLVKYKWNKQNYEVAIPELETSTSEISAETREIIDATIQDNTEINFNKYGVSTLSLSEDAEVTLHFVGHGKSERQNALAYYVYESDQVPSLATVNKSLILAYADLYNTATGAGVKLKYQKPTGEWVDKFPAGSTIGFALLVDAYQNGTITSSSNVAYSNNKFNNFDITYIGSHGKTEMTQAREVPFMGVFKANDVLVVAFEDQPYHQGYVPADCRDAMFTITATPISAFPDIPDGKDPNKDPEYIGTAESCGILSFEDNWPKRGDYDLNDVVISYIRKLNFDESIKVVSIDEEYTFLNNGANFSDAFAYQIGGQLKRNDAQVTITSDYNCPNQGLDPDLDDATVILFDNGKKVELGTKFFVKTILKTPIDFPNFSASLGFPYNPFIINSGYDPNNNILSNGRTEVHLPKYKPTTKVNTDLFGTEDDLSGNGNYYVRAGNYPFAIDITKAYSSELPVYLIPAETKPIDTTYPLFKTWVESNGQSAKDWYESPVNP